MILSDLVQQMTHHHIASAADPVPERRGISYVWAGNGVFKYGRNADTEVIVRWNAGYTPGLPDLQASIAWDEWPGRLPGALLTQVLEEARAATAPKGGPGEDAAALVPVEAQWLVVLDDDHQPRLMRPAQTASPGQVRYALEGAPFLLDIHSHHEMEPFFSGTDDQDDTWLSASVVIGDIAGAPGLLCRLNVYGTRQIVPAALLFDDLGSFDDRFMSLLDMDTASPEADVPAPTEDPWAGVSELLKWLTEGLAAAGIEPLTDESAAAELLSRLDAALKAESGVLHATTAA